MAAAKRYVILPDVQVPFHDARLWRAFVAFLADYQPDKLFCVGDFSDSQELSRWVRGMKGEYAGTLQRNLDMAAGMLAEIRDVYDGPFRISRSNHDDRLALYLEQKAPALEGLRDLTIEKQLRLDDLDITYERKIIDVAPGVVLMHGDEGNLSSTPGMTALKLVRKVGKSVICGHTHRLGLTAESTGYNGRVRTLFGMEAGHFMNPAKADYLKTGAANWQAGFATVHVFGSLVHPAIVPATNGRFVVEGEVYGGRS